jgi:hypothetical protein
MNVDPTKTEQGSQGRFVISVLEEDQLSQAKKRPIPRRHLRGPELAILWLLRIYLLFMIAVVIYQVWSGGH